ncbi:nucleotidyltransferase [Paenibacillus sp. 1001270B_150601_E10]|uniref:nucleotidyltransferase n=1 Tax=Paenibacillus sp. 1001270B_150601_E10 TaxID=2787079 RepID=UPI00189EA815|nr:nucleotidyltransferase [Paenibacillus sp. 1001270B_150601_E10]
MRTVGIIVEYNPFHNGHVYHLKESARLTEADAVVAVMSGHFLQRGEPAIVDKWARADMALKQGADLVIELPVAYAVQPAEWFAYGAVASLEATGVVDALCFGSELGDIKPLTSAAKLLSEETEGFQALLQQALKSGMNYPAAFAAAASQRLEISQPSSVDGNAVEATGGTKPQLVKDALNSTSSKPWIAEPNNSLGLHYILALGRLKSSIQPYTIARQKAGYHEQEVHDSTIASATAIRRLIAEHRNPSAYMPNSSWDILQQCQRLGRGSVTWQHFAESLLYQLQRSTRDQLAALLEVNEGLEYRLEQALPQLRERSVEELLEHLKSKRYTRTKLQRMLTHILLGHDKDHFGPDALSHGPSYIRVLGFSERGQALLKQMRKTSSLPIIHKADRENAVLGGRNGLQADIQATAVYAGSFSAWNGKLAYRDYFEPPRRV